jgi:hypothetical protein
VAGLGPLLKEENIHKTLASIYQYNYRSQLYGHDSVQRVYALNDEAALVICDYGKAERPRIPFPYYAEAWTGLEYLAASHMIYAGMTAQGVECVRNARSRHDGEKHDRNERNAVINAYESAWSGILALSGFHYGPRKLVTAIPRARTAGFFVLVNARRVRSRNRLVTGASVLRALCCLESCPVVRWNWPAAWQPEFSRQPGLGRR